MKTLILIRHSKSDWSKKELSDRQRPLNKRGKRDAPLMAKLLYERGDIHPSLIISSPAERSMQTAKEFARVFGYDLSKILYREEIYTGNIQAILNLISNIDDHHNCILLFGHNPDITLLANQLSDVLVENIPTTGIFCIDFDINQWREILSQKGKNRFFEFPKKHFKKEQ
ncbi:MAG: SixA phosphatase family protein [Candidatus Kapaibacteriales bacterium]